ncbi:pesticin C-terminus-like muramidase [Pseudomonas chlororaphis]|uniref:pesticin C-terminus-like muramidase n=1 Tax=Pseudomonas chlororaphis TaxID=587753 RepID=UPI002367935F|nr:pesticin C-terminus-like muramidase [Pseudomonas chlororaphis]WDH35288.1 pesticin C-terminus-like muramidase [Pseudomonas chlororaphis]WDH41373.1 pesticin C-terminus-like muramidase [Pseudomonas chlororaphis]
MAETTTSKVEKWAYPLKAEASEVTDLMQYYKALAKAKDGYYPLGSNGLWHGGVHFDEDTGLVADKSEVRCIADGEVVAYRIDEKYPTSNYGSTPSVFSTGFVLVKHRLELPAPPAPAGSPPPAAGPSLTFFSLYMHLLDWEGYKASPALKRPAFWGKGSYQVKANAPDKSLGLRVRSGNSKQTPVLTVLPRGTTVTTKPAPATQKWLEIVSVTPEVATLPANTGWIFKGEMKHLSGDIYFVGEQANDVPPGQQKGAYVRSAVTHGLPLGFLPAGTQIKISDEPTANKYRKLLEIVTGESVPALTLGADGTLPGYVSLDSLEAKSEPKTPGTIVPLTPVHKIKAGELIGHVGKYQNYSDAAPKNLLHLEVFSCEDIKAFIDQTKEQAVRLPATEKTLVKILPDTPLITHVPGMNASNPPKANDASKKVGYGLLIPVSVLEALPAEKKIKAPVVMNGVTTYTQWWHLEGLLADAQGESIDGWFAEPNTTLYRHSPFEWENFTFIEETGSNVDLYADFLHAQENMTDEERKAYHPNIVTAGAGPTKQSLYTILDRNRDTKLPPEEIRNALSKPWFAQPVSQMIIKYESEWDYKAAKWDSLDELMGHSNSNPHKEWVEEKARIGKLKWLRELIEKGCIAGDEKVWHIHPVGLLGNFASGCPEKCKATVHELQTTVGKYVVSKKLFEFILEIEAYREHPYALSDNNSGVTIGYGYDLGQQTATSVDNDLEGLYTADEITSLKGALGKKGQDARDYVHNVSSISISKDNALKLALIMKKRYAQQVVDVYPQAINLHPDCQGALLSLVINRGNALSGTTPAKAEKRLEMKQIKEDFDAGKPELIPSRFRSMKRLWENNSSTSGLVTRREKEAVFFEEALKCNCWK